MDPELTGQVIRAMIMAIAFIWAMWPMLNEVIEDVRRN